MMETVHVGLGERAYDIQIGPGLLARAGALIAPLLKRPMVRVVTDENVAALHLETLRKGLKAEGVEMEALVLPAGGGYGGGYDSGPSGGGSQGGGAPSRDLDDEIPF